MPSKARCSWVQLSSTVYASMDGMYVQEAEGGLHAWLCICICRVVVDGMQQLCGCIFKHYETCPIQQLPLVCSLSVA